MKTLTNRLLAVIRFILINLQASFLTVYRAHSVANWSFIDLRSIDIAKKPFTLLTEPKAVADNKHLLQFYLSGVTTSRGHDMDFRGIVIAYKSAISDIENADAKTLWGSLIFEPLTWLSMTEKYAGNYNPHHRNLVNVLKHRFWSFSFWTFFLTGDVRHGCLAGKAAFALLISWKEKSKIWFSLYRWYAYKARLWQKLYTDQGKQQCATVGRAGDLVAVEKGLAALALMEKEILGKEDFLVPWQHLPRYYTMSAVSQKAAEKKAVPYWLLGAMASLNGFVGAAHVIKTLSGNSDTLFDYFSTVFGPVTGKPRIVKLYPSKGSGTFHVYPKANKVLYKWVHESGNHGGVLVAWGNAKWGLHTLKTDLVPHHFKLWIWKGSPENGEWFVKDSLTAETDEKLNPPNHNGDFPDFSGYDHIGCRVYGNGVQVFYNSGHYLIIKDETLTIKTTTQTPFWLTHKEGHSCFTHFKNFSLCQTKNK